MAAKMAALFRCYRVSLACRPVVTDEINFLMWRQCASFSRRCDLSCLATENGISPISKNTFGYQQTSLVGLQEKRFFTSSSVTPNDNPQISKS